MDASTNRTRGLELRLLDQTTSRAEQGMGLQLRKPCMPGVKSKVQKKGKAQHQESLLFICFWVSVMNEGSSALTVACGIWFLTRI